MSTDRYRQLPTLRIHAPDPIMRGAEVELDGHPIRGLVSLRLEIAEDEINTVELRINLGSVDVTAATMVALEAIVAAAGPDGVSGA